MDEKMYNETGCSPESCGGNCSSCGESAGCGGSCGGGAMQPEDFLKPANQFSNIKKVIGVVSGKGGVGKSMVTSLLAVMMQRRGYMILL